MGDSSLPNRQHFSAIGLSPAFAGLNLWALSPGADAPGFMLTPASQAKTVPYYAKLSQAQIRPDAITFKTYTLV